jgi:hypothetical protein
MLIPFHLRTWNGASAAKSGEQDLWLTPGNWYFCARRLWDQKAEAIFMKAIEDRCQCVAKSIVAGAITTLDAGMTAASPTYICCGCCGTSVTSIRFPMRD